jgi:ABC-2 type transport system permease protein
MSVVTARYAALSRRSLVNIVRQPIAIVPAFAFPLLFLALNSAALAESIELPGFPRVDSFLQFMVATTIIQGGLFGAIAAGSGMAIDIEGGFFDRILATPVSRTSILVGGVAGSFALAFVQAFFFLGIGILFGLEVEGGPLGMVGVAVISSIAGAGVGAIAVAIGIKSGSAEVVQGSFPLIFVSLFLSSAFFPRSLMDGWFKTAATVNPLSHMIEGARSLVISGWDTGEFAGGLGIASGILVVGISASLLALRSRLADRV